MSKLEKYSSYKDSGVDWLGEIPEEWDVKKLKYVVKVHGGNGFPITEQGNTDGKIPFFKVSDINGKNIYVSQSNNYVSDNTIKNMKWNFIPCGSIVTAKIGEALRKNHRKITSVPSIIDNNCIAFEPKKIETKFNYYLHKTIDFDWFSNVGAVPSISVSGYKNFKASIPQKQEQIKIASFLDTKTEQLDKAIKQKEQLIELLKERRQILIKDAVTKGIDETVKMKDSGVEWIGDIPEHWEVKKLKYVFSFSKGLTITKENLIDDGIKCVNYGEIHSKYGFEINPQIHNLKCVDARYLKSDNKSLLNFGDFVYADTSEDIEGSGNFTYLNSNIKTFAGYHTVICRPKRKIDSRFIAYEFDSSTFRYQIQRKVKGVKVYSITQGMLKDITLWLPPLSEQEELVKIIDSKTSKLDKAIDLQQQQITKLKEYKTTLIDSVVTGKMRVSG